MKVVYTAQSLDDLKELGDWISRDGPALALRFVRDLRARCRSLAAYPARFPIVSERRGEQVRRCVHRGYLILFQIDTGQGAVVILRVANGVRDYNRLIGQPGMEDDD